MIAIIGVVAVLATSATLHSAVAGVFGAGERMIAAHPVAGMAVFVALSAAAAMLAFVSASIIVPVAILRWGVLGSILLLWSGWIIGGICAYCIGRWAGRPALRWLLSEQKLGALESRMQRDASFTVVFLFQLALPSEIPGYVLGLSRYRLSSYLLALALAELPFAAATVFAAAGFIEQRGFAVLAWGVALIAFSVAALWILRRKLGQSRQ